MEEDPRSRKSRDIKYKRDRYYTEDDNIYYRDTEDTNARPRQKDGLNVDQRNIDDDTKIQSYHGRDEKETRSYRELDQHDEKKYKKETTRRRLKESDEKRPSPEGAYEKRSHRRRHKSSEKTYRSKSRDRKQSRDRKSVRYEEEDEITENKRKDYERGRSEERRKSKRHEERSEKHNEEEDEENERRQRRREKSKHKRDKELREENDDEVMKSKRHENEEYIQTEDSLEKTRRERSKERSKRKKSRDRVRRREKEKERNNISISEDEITQKEERKKRKSRRSHRSKDKRSKEEIINDISFAAPSETYEEMKKTSIDWQPSGHNKKKASDKHRKERKDRYNDENESENESEIEDSRKQRVKSKESKKLKKKEKVETILKNAKYTDDEGICKEKLSKSNRELYDEKQTERSKPKRNYIPEYTDSKSSSLTGYDSDTNSKRYKSKSHRKSLTEHDESKPNRKKYEANIKKEIRKKREPRLYHSDSEVDIKKITTSRVQINVPNSNDDTSSILSNENPDLESLYSYYKEPEQKDQLKEVTIRASSRESNDPPTKISINQTNIRGKLIRVLFQRVKELLKETEELRHERKLLTTKIKHLNEELSNVQQKEETQFAKGESLEKRLQVLAEEMKITAKGTSFREEIHKILHDIQDKYQIHWREHETKIQQVQNDAEHNIQTLMKSIVGKYVEMSELKQSHSKDDIIKENHASNLQYKNEYKNTESVANLIKDKATTEWINSHGDSSVNKETIRTVKSDSSLAEAQSVYLQRKAARKEINRETETYQNPINGESELFQNNENHESGFSRKITDQETAEKPLWYEKPRQQYYPVQERENRWENGNIKAGIQKLFMNDALRANQKPTRLNEPLYIDTGTNSDGRQQENQTGRESGQYINSNKELLLQIASIPKNTEQDFTERRQSYLTEQERENLLRREKTYCGGETVISDKNQLRQDSLTSSSEKKTSYDTDNLNDMRNTNSRYFYDDLKQPQYKMNVKEFWRQKLLKPTQQTTNTTIKTRHDADPFDNKTVRNTY